MTSLGESLNNTEGRGLHQGWDFPVGKGFLDQLFGTVPIETRRVVTDTREMDACWMKERTVVG